MPSASGTSERASAAALHQAVTLERVGHEIAQRVRRALPSELIAVARWTPTSGVLELIAASASVPVDDLGTIVRAACNGEPAAPTWAAAGADLVTVTMPIGGGGYLVVGMTPDDAADRSAAEQALLGIAADAGIALDRAAEVSRLGERERVRGMERAAAGIAHDLRNPLFSIASAAQLLRHAIGEDDPVVERNIGRILREVDRLSALMGGLLEFGQPVPVQREPGDPDQVWTDVLSTARATLEPRAVVVDHRPAAPRARCAIDAEQLGRAFEHLLRHAVGEASPGSDIVIAAVTDANGRWRCTMRFRNDRPADEIVATPFEPFEAGATTARDMGLAVASRILLAHDGAVASSTTAGGERALTISLGPP